MVKDILYRAISEYSLLLKGEVEQYSNLFLHDMQVIAEYAKTLPSFSDAQGRGGSPSYAPISP